jgi:hypothetical protein
MLKSLLAAAGIEIPQVSTGETFEPSMTFARAIAALAEAMTPEQCRRAAGTLRTLAGAAEERTYFMTLADNLEEYAEGVAEAAPVLTRTPAPRPRSAAPSGESTPSS